MDTPPPMDTHPNIETFFSTSGEGPRQVQQEAAPPQLALVVLWGRQGPERAGECFLIPQGGDQRPWVIGCRSALGERRLSPMIQRPSYNSFTAPLMEPRVSRDQLKVGGQGGGLWVSNQGRRQLTIDGEPATNGVRYPLREGQVLDIGGQLLFLVTTRPYILPGPHDSRVHGFGDVDALGLVGESPALWALRHRIDAWAVVDDAHVLIRGPSGSGKEKVARAIHARSPRGGKALISRSAVSIPEGLMDAELFGNIQGFPNPGMKATLGLLGEAKGSSIFLDEIGELGFELQARLLRVMDAGEYTPLGAGRPTQSDVRFIAATNREEIALKHDLLPRFNLRIDVPGLGPRREDIPLILRHLLRGIKDRHPALVAPFLPKAQEARGDDLPQLSPGFVSALVTHPYTTHVRELTHLIYQSLEESPGPELLAPKALIQAQSAPPKPPKSKALASTSPPAPLPPLAEHILTEEERLRLKMMGAHGFSATRCGEDPAFPTNRQNATLTLTLCFAKALMGAGWRVDVALSLIEEAGGLSKADVASRGRLRRSLGRFLSNQRAASKSPEVARGDTSPALRRYGAGAGTIQALQLALAEGKVTGEDALLRA